MHIDFADDDGRCNETRTGNIVRLLTFVPGTILKLVPYTARLMYDVGKAVGAIDLTLQVGL